MKIISLSGKKQVGKNTVARLIGELVDCSVKEFAFADALKFEVCRAFGISIHTLHKDKAKYRQLLQAWGVLRRVDYENYWIDRVMEKMIISDAELVLITDVRFPNEYKAMKEVSTVVRVVRNTGLVDNHESETALDQYSFSHIIANDGSLSQLKEQVNNLLTELQIKTK